MLPRDVGNHGKQIMETNRVKLQRKVRIVCSVLLEPREAPKIEHSLPFVDFAAFPGCHVLQIVLVVCPVGASFFFFFCQPINKLLREVGVTAQKLLSIESVSEQHIEF